MSVQIIRSLPRMFILILYFENFMIFGKNIDTNNPILFHLPQSSLTIHSSLFGHSVLMNENDNGPIFFVGAPNASDHSLWQPNNTGLVYRCEWSQQASLNTNCYPMDLSKKMNYFLKDSFTQNMHLGWNINYREKTQELLTCAFSRTIEIMAFNKEKQELWIIPNGACYLIPLESDPHLEDIRLILPMNNERQFPNGRYLYAYGMAGMSASFSQDQNEIYIGAPGYDGWRGCAVGVNFYNYPSYATKLDDKFEIFSQNIQEFSYMGYSVSNGNYFQDKFEYIALGAPRNNQTGSVFLFDTSWNMPNILHGNQLFEYFGYSLLTLDINQDTFDDLLVSAPMYSSFDDSYDEGRVFVYISNGKQSFKEPKIIYGDSKVLARFGTAMANVGDINKDNFIDIAIGAPYEDNFKGSIYIYLGSSHGLKSDKYWQKISAKDHLLSINLQGFGYSMSSMIDADNNGYNDIFVGSYLTENALLLRTRPVISIVPSIHLSQDYVDLNETCKYSEDLVTSLDLSHLACIRLKYCFNFPSKIRQSFLNLMLLATLKLDPNQYRAFVLTSLYNTNELKLLTVLNQEFSLTNTKNEICSDYYIIRFKKLNQINNFGPIAFELDYEIKAEQNNDDNLFYIPVLDNEKTNISAEINIKMCGNTAYDCVSNIHLNPIFVLDNQKELILPTNTKYQLIEGTSRVLSLTVNTINYNEPAFKTNLSIETNQNVSLINMDRKCHQISELSSIKFICSLEDPLYTSDQINLTFQSFRINNNENVFFKLNTEIMNKLNIESNAQYEIFFQVIKNATINLLTNNQTINRPYPKDKFEIKFETKFQLKRIGPSTIDSIQLNIIYPNSYNEHELISNVQIRPFSLIETFCEPAVVYGNHIEQLNEHYPTTENETLIYFNKDSDYRIINSNCANKMIICKVVRCHIGPWISQESEQLFNLISYANIANIGNKFEKFNQLSFYLNLDVSINDVHLQSEQSLQHQFDTIRLNYIPLFIKKEINYWLWSILGIIIGILLLMSIIGILYRCGFFRRYDENEDEDDDVAE